MSYTTNQLIDMTVKRIKVSPGLVDRYIQDHGPSALAQLTETTNWDLETKSGIYNVAYVLAYKPDPKRMQAKIDTDKKTGDTTVQIVDSTYEAEKAQARKEQLAKAKQTSQQANAPAQGGGSQAQGAPSLAKAMQLIQEGLAMLEQVTGTPASPNQAGANGAQNQAGSGNATAGTPAAAPAAAPKRPVVPSISLHDWIYAFGRMRPQGDICFVLSEKDPIDPDTPTFTGDSGGLTFGALKPLIDQGDCYSIGNGYYGITNSDPAQPSDLSRKAQQITDWLDAMGAKRDPSGQVHILAGLN